MHRDYNHHSYCWAESTQFGFLYQLTEVMKMTVMNDVYDQCILYAVCIQAHNCIKFDFHLQRYSLSLNFKKLKNYYYFFFYLISFSY